MSEQYRALTKSSESAAVLNGQPSLLTFLVFTVDKQYALGLRAVERVVNAVEISSLPKGPDIVMGVINLQGSIVPVVNVRKRFRLPERPMIAGDRLIIAATSRWRVALLVDSVNGVIEREQHEVIRPETIVCGMEYVKGVTKLDENIVLIHDLDRFLSLDEERTMEEALAAQR